jgi:hypothetical protein
VKQGEKELKMKNGHWKIQRRRREYNGAAAGFAKGK